MAIELIPVQNKDGKLKCSTCHRTTSAYVGITSISEDVTPQFGGEVMSVKSKRVLICKACLGYMEDLISAAILHGADGQIEENPGEERAKPTDEKWINTLKLRSIMI